jgi:hypothetical protein
MEILLIQKVQALYVKLKNIGKLTLDTLSPSFFTHKKISLLQKK